jgi:hypothetical protein
MYPQGCGGSSPFFGTITFVICDLQAGATYAATTVWRRAPCPTEKSISPNESVRHFVVLFANGRVKPDAVLLDGREERHPEGSYNIEWREGKKRVRLSVGKDPQDAAARRLRKEAELNAVNNGVNVVPEGKPQGRRRIADAIGEYLSEIKLSRSTATHSAYTLALRNFTDRCQKSHLEEIDRKG